MNELKELPDGWMWVKLKDIGRIVSGGTPSTAVGEYWGGNVNWISPSDLTGFKEKTISKGKKSIIELGLRSSSAKMIIKGSVLFSSRAPIGYVAIASAELCTNQGFKNITPGDNINSNYLYHYLKASKHLAEKVASGTTFIEISLRSFSELPFPLPPLITQQAIVSKIDELFSELDKGVENLKTAQQQLKVYRQAVLKWAFEGRLTNGLNQNATDLSDEHDLAMVAEPNGVYSKANNLNHDFKDLPDGHDLSANNTKRHLRNQVNQKNQGADNEGLPVGWKLVTIDEFLIDKKGMGTGPFGTMLKKSEHQKTGVPVLGIENIGEGKFQMPNKIFVTSEKAKELKSFRVKENDVIISRSGTVGEICLLPKSMEGSIISTNLIRVTLNEKIINPKYFVYLFQGGKVRQDVYLLCKGSSRAFLNQTILKSLDFPLCSLGTQFKVIQEIESRLSVADKMEESIQQSLLQAESLRQSILKKAFEGRLIK